ncbi:carbon-monoxide dehydrogenase medium subunit [Saccharopolyspora erythraea NRRL 2338]|uniref:Carbon monoxide dehydrogenase medium subunit n=2 Tax=Saccharopolyspora erythraea TaxID=1836 RepID=A4FJB5_SACEN|nr:FAD binding domain-containing protein [Saccharopolyspora erythraea]EQD85360.1 carbon-monoxide dehydrogenase [Saccharopolyspora erythraea D]PFG97809.1 carbon-monoxide dehydrogenase medium subunit [Saccharopolyspora erythraea NRRL 2338]QRK87948.1 FAD binding domain-containing protein [Saccharopolyspora erythraea]CAM04140.1 carbon monoxide dehydrogenase medium subunit [Saccharopolyspora erythraea NRRL 2338]
MVCVPFEYTAVSTYDDAVRALVEHGEDAKVLAGGQSLGPMLALRLARPAVVIDINDIDQGQPEVAGEVLRIPALTRHRTVVDSPLVRQHAPMLSECTSRVGNVRVRNRGTIGGSLAHADPTAEIPCAALALGADIVVRGPDGDRAVPARDFFVTYLTTALEPSEVVREVRLPALRPQQGWSFHELVRRASDFAVVAVAVVVELESDAATVRSAEVALAGVADRPVPAGREAVAPLIGSSGAPAEVAAAAAAIAGNTSPDGDVHASGAYRRRLVDVLTRRALTEALGRARTSGVVT